MDFRPSILAIGGAISAEKRSLLEDFVALRRAEGLRVAGIVETPEPGEGGACGALYVVNLATGARIGISQNLGPGSTACNLDPGGVAEACAAAQAAIEAGADVVVLSKFGKLEAGGGGLCDAFFAAAEAGIPVVTTLHPILREDWARFAGDLAEEIAPEAQALDAWWREMTARRQAA
jgi:nucleoside-triphosphatase THEP1